MNEFVNRTEAGKALAAELVRKGYGDPVILALPRGGVPVAIEVVRALRAPMDLVMVRKIGVPTQPELAVAAIVNGDHPQLAINEAVAEHAELSHDDIDRMAQTKLVEIRRRRDLYLKGRGSIPIEGRTAIVVDDGIATGATMRASLKAVRLRKPAKLVLAVPVAAPDTLEEFRSEVDEIVCLLKPQRLIAVGAHYVDFGQTSDEDVVRLMDEADRLTQ
ncbi:phosphoribosyltransferase [Thalassovita taeanensis]|uniref:Putative phosphoribosyl transferase n=1 Tax=Thalassovita taeanensis TaxID=657014 RepID=A0A1H9GF39_9RHOB|nr:phosphoribosyltransferase family protein [Thalassovita taeanensis]SEQ48674.1 putative phosphoribosyl transferase [Thalassovita taeanensis]